MKAKYSWQTHTVLFTMGNYKCIKCIPRHTETGNICNFCNKLELTIYPLGQEYCMALIKIEKVLDNSKWFCCDQCKQEYHEIY